jgi:hypothetical protein
MNIGAYISFKCQKNMKMYKGSFPVLVMVCLLLLLSNEPTLNSTITIKRA